MSFLKTMSVIILMLAMFFSLIATMSHLGCGASIEDIQLDDSSKVKVAIEAGCAVAATNGCFDNADIKTLLGNIKTSDQCVAAISTAIKEKKITVDIVKIASDLMDCRAFRDSLKKVVSSEDYPVTLNITNAIWIYEDGQIHNDRTVI